MSDLRRLLFVLVGLSGFIVVTPAPAKYIGADAPLRCNSACPTCQGGGGPVNNCSSSEQCTGGTCFSRTEGNQKETYSGAAVKGGVGSLPGLSVSYNSYNADTSRARIDTVLGNGWTHNYNVFLYVVRGDVFRVDGDGRITRYKLGAGGIYTTAAGYFETLVKTSASSFTLTQKDKTVYEFALIPGTPFLLGTPVYQLTKVSDRNNNATNFSYSSGLLSQVSDPYGHSLSFTYNPQKRLATVTDPLLRVTSFSYDSSGAQLVKITDPAGMSVQYSYNYLFQIVRKVDKDGRVFSYSYQNNEPVGLTDGAGGSYFQLSNPNNWATDDTALALNLVRQYVPGTASKVDGRGNVWRYSYESHGYVTQMRAPDGATWNYTYDAGTLMPASETDARNNLTKYEYDAQGNLTKKTDALNFVTSYTYEATFNQMTSMTDANGRVTTYEYDARGNRIKETDPLLQTRSWTYDARGNVLSETDKNGHTTSYQYDAQGNRIQRTDALNNVTRMTYDANGNLLSRTDANNHTTSYQYDALDRVIKMTDPAGKLTQTTYDGQGNRLSMTDRNGNATQFQYDQRSRLIQTTDALGKTMKYVYDGNDNRVSTTDKNNHTTSFSYDVQNRLTQSVDALGNTATMAYDATGNRVKDTDANAHSTDYTYDALNRMVTRRDAVGSLTVMVYDSVGPCAGCTGPTRGSGLVAKQTDGNGKVTYLKYDALDRLIRQIRKQTDTADSEDGDDAVTVYSYDAVGNRLTVKEPNGNVMTYTYDALDRTVKEVNAAGDMTSYAYDGVGNVTKVTAPTTNETNYSYDALDRVSLMQDGGGTVASYTYDAVGNRLTQTDGNMNTTSSAYDAIYRVVQTTDPLGKSASYTYDPVGNMLSATDRNGNVTSYIYDAINRRVSMTDALPATTQYQYDAVGNLTRLTDANAHATSYTYDGVNRRVSESYADGFTKSYTYDFVGNLTGRTDQNGIVTSYSYSDLYFLLKRDYPGVDHDDTMSYDLSGRMLSACRGGPVDDVVDGCAGWLVSFSYDGANRVTQSMQNGKTVSYNYHIPAPTTRTLVYPGARTITERMDLRSRITSIDDAAPNLAQYSYDAANRVVSRTYRNGTMAAYGYNANDWIVSLEHSLGVTRIAGFGHAYDNEGNKRFEEKRLDTANSQMKSEAYQYDTIYRVIDYRVGTLSGSTVPVPSTQTQYSLDPVGNWNVKTKDTIPELRTHNAVNELTAINAAPLAYDNSGNLTEDTLYRYAYDEENRLMAVTRKSDAALVGHYLYDALARRVQKIANPAGTATTTRYCYDSARIVEEQSASGATQATYVYGNYIDEVLNMDRSAVQYFYHQNALWSVEAITDGTASVVERYGYDAYGLPAVTNGAGVAVAPNAWGTAHSAIGNPWMFTGRQDDEETGLYFYRARYYDPGKGRFLQRDPLGYMDGLNLYEYVRSNPINKVDPSGLETIGLYPPKNNDPDANLFGRAAARSTDRPLAVNGVCDAAIQLLRLKRQGVRIDAIHIFGHANPDGSYIGSEPICINPTPWNPRQCPPLRADQRRCLAIIGRLVEPEGTVYFNGCYTGLRLSTLSAFANALGIRVAGYNGEVTYSNLAPGGYRRNRPWAEQLIAVRPPPDHPRLPELEDEEIDRLIGDLARPGRGDLKEMPALERAAKKSPQLLPSQILPSD